MKKGKRHSAIASGQTLNQQQRNELVGLFLLCEGDPGVLKSRPELLVLLKSWLCAFPIRRQLLEALQS